MNCTFCQDKLTLLRHELDQARICCEKFAPLGSVFESPFMSNFSWLVAVLPSCLIAQVSAHASTMHQAIPASLARSYSSGRALSICIRIRLHFRQVSKLFRNRISEWSHGAPRCRWCSMVSQVATLLGCFEFLLFSRRSESCNTSLVAACGCCSSQCCFDLGGQAASDGRRVKESKKQDRLIESNRPSDSMTRKD